MQCITNPIFRIFSIALILCGLAATANGQDINVQLSSREAYVGQPIILQVLILNASDFERPAIPEIDGCEVQPAGPASQSTQVSIINGRRRESRSVALQYLITPRRAGSFEVPPFQVEVNGKSYQVDPLRFVATISETGDLLFAEIGGGRERVYVGQPLDLKLKIWIKPFVDRERRIQLSEAQMWQLLSDQTSWGSFENALQEMAENNQRPGGKEVLRDNGNGEEQAYYLYEINATVYPKRPGRIDADDVQIVVNYPTAIGRKQDPFDRFFQDDFMGGSRLSQMMQDDFFSSPFGNRLSITATRPITATANVDATEVIPVPLDGRPADYRGAVGTYQIVTQANPTNVAAGDPITLQIGVVGSGPMELVQAPPLSKLPFLTRDFKVEDQSLAGFVRNDTKVFPATIRPRRAGITAIPPIPFSFFDPQTESFQTVMSEPIDIVVNEAESLAMDAIVSGERPKDTVDNSSGSRTLKPDFTNVDSLSLLDASPATKSAKAWTAFLVVPPIFWLVAVVVARRSTIAALFVRAVEWFQSDESRCRQAIGHAKSLSQIEAALIRFVASKTKANPDVDRIHSIGSLRSNGYYSLAAELETFFQQFDQASNHADQPDGVELQRTEAVRMMENIANVFADGNKVLKQPKVKPAIRPTNAAVCLLACLAWSSSAIASPSAEREVVTTKSITPTPSDSLIVLTRSQQESLLTEASKLYQDASDLPESERAEAIDRFAQSASKYQLLVDSGIDNSDLLFNLGNAYLQSNQLGRSIAAYIRAQRIDPSNQQISANLQFAQSLVKAAPEGTNQASPSNWFDALQESNKVATATVTPATMNWTMAIASLCFWGLLTAGLFLRRFPAKRLAIAPMLVLLITGTSLVLTQAEKSSRSDGIFVVNNVVLRWGDGEQFSSLATLSSTDGQRISILSRRGGWSQIRTSQEQIGWVPDDAHVVL